jgi:hypothetical protein
VFDKLVQVSVFGGSYARIGDSTCSATTLRDRRDEWIAAGVFEQLAQLCLQAFDRVVGLQLQDLTVDSCIVKATCGGQAAGRFPVDRGKLGTKRCLLTSDRAGIPLRCVVAPANTTTHRCCCAHPGEAGPVRLRPARPDHRAPRRRLRQHQDTPPP